MDDVDAQKPWSLATVQNTSVLAEVGNWSEILMVHVVVGSPQGRSMAQVRASFLISLWLCSSLAVPLAP